MRGGFRMKEENEYDKPIFPLRKILLRLALIIAIIILVAWLVPKFFTNKDTVSKTVKSKNTTETVKIESNNMQKLESAGLKYFNKENISSSITNDLQKKQIIFICFCILNLFPDSCVFFILYFFLILTFCLDFISCFFQI